MATNTKRSNTERGNTKRRNVTRSWWPLRSSRRSRVLAMWCPICDRWVKPRRFRTPAGVCRDCAPIVQPPVRIGGH